MPWQSAPSLLIIIGAFNVAAGAVWGIQRIAYGKDREILRDQWKWALENRDLRIEQYRADQAKQGK
eukprot:CAMPEP_0178683588 /NCGR_PEP_ID=MMETSP0699-20121125/2387_1 /TAXON_ID=265572 /ORGANISM="Extubocellulus spinifer, Strain CCMP396" /LENGTH=65 /DNA_ID=CAMNT_0020328199 /DNA_START=30 /DNA_END=227 /DNA_ORIENTATION=+